MDFAKLRFRDFSFPLSYLVATLLVALATLLTSGLWLIVDRPISAPLFLATIALSCWLGGLRVGIYTSLVAGFAIDYYFIPPFHAFAGTRDEVVRLALFFGEGSLLSWLVERLRLASEEIRVSREELRELTMHQQTLRESEQKRIALEIHDELGQALTSLKMDTHFLGRRIQALRPENEREEILSDLSGLAGRIDNTIGTVRRITSELRPSILDDFGLVAASEWQAREFQRSTEIACRFTSDVEELNLGSDSNTAVFRILQEALTNVARHASARSVSIELRRTAEEVKMTVADDGKGIDPANKKYTRSVGLLGMRERSRIAGGQLNIFNNPAGGTIVELRIPASRATG
jgi:signal transduction histidine kinase